MVNADKAKKHAHRRLTHILATSDYYGPPNIVPWCMLRWCLLGLELAYIPRGSSRKKNSPTPPAHASLHENHRVERQRAVERSGPVQENSPGLPRALMSDNLEVF